MKKVTTTKKATTTKKVKATKAAPVKKSNKKPIEDLLEEIAEEGEEEGGKIKTILMLWVKGYSRKEIIAAGYNKSTVYRQTGDFEKLKNAPAKEYYGFDLFETRVEKYMKAKGVTRDKAVAALLHKDLEA